jgi:hypothetical protein
MSSCLSLHRSIISLFYKSAIETSQSWLRRTRHSSSYRTLLQRGQSLGLAVLSLLSALVSSSRAKMLQEDENKSKEETAEQGHTEEALTVELENVRKKEPYSVVHTDDPLFFVAFFYQCLPLPTATSLLLFIVLRVLNWEMLFLSRYYYLTLSSHSFFSFH